MCWLQFTAAICRDLLRQGIYACAHFTCDKYKLALVKAQHIWIIVHGLNLYMEICNQQYASIISTRLWQSTNHMIHNMMNIQNGGSITISSLPVFICTKCKVGVFLQMSIQGPFANAVLLDNVTDWAQVHYCKHIIYNRTY